MERVREIAYKKKLIKKYDDIKQSTRKGKRFMIK